MTVMDTQANTRFTGQGLHLDLVTEISPSDRLASPCNLHMLYSLPSSFILDVFQLADLIEERRLLNNSGQVQLMHVDEVDLELPFEQADRSPALAWFNLGPLDEAATVTLPLHLRTHLPKEPGQRMRNLTLHGPLLLQACDPPREDEPMCSPEQRRSLPAGLSRDASLHPLISLCSFASQPLLAARIPVGDLSHQAIVSQTNLFVMWTGVLVILYIAVVKQFGRKDERKGN